MFENISEPEKRKYARCMIEDLQRIINSINKMGPYPNGEYESEFHGDIHKELSIVADSVDNLIGRLFYVAPSQAHVSFDHGRTFVNICRGDEFFPERMNQDVVNIESIKLGD